MRILVRSVEPGLKRLIGWGDGADGRIPAWSDGTVGYVRRETSGRWMVTDHIRGADVEYSETGYRHAILSARHYFAPRSFCGDGCGRLTAGDVCGQCQKVLV